MMRWVIGVTALVTVTISLALGLIFGWIAELIRAAILRGVLPEALTENALKRSNDLTIPVIPAKAGIQEQQG